MVIRDFLARVFGAPNRKYYGAKIAASNRESWENHPCIDAFGDVHGRYRVVAWLRRNWANRADFIGDLAVHTRPRPWRCVGWHYLAVEICGP